MIWKIKHDVKRFLAEDIVVYSFLLFVSLFKDFFVRGWDIFMGHRSIHPLELGVYQILGAIFFVIQLVRSIRRWQYHK